MSGVCQCQYSSVLASPYDSPLVSLRKLAQKLGVAWYPGDRANNIWRRILSDPNWTLGVSDPDYDPNAPLPTGLSNNEYYRLFTRRTNLCTSRNIHDCVKTALDPTITTGGGGGGSPVVPGFDDTLCRVTILDGGGTTFDCYVVGSYDHMTNIMELGGTGLDAIEWSNADGAAIGISFDANSIGALTDTTAPPDVGVDLVSFGDGQSIYKGDPFTAYAVGSLSDGIPSSSTGLTAYYSGG